jgi:hypothetical protein
MPNPHRADISRLAKRVDALSNALARLSNASDFRKLILLLRRPGWTTPAEFAFAMGIVESMTAQAKALGQLKSGLLKGSRAVSTKQR